MLGISAVTLYALERRGELHPERHMRENKAGHQQLMYVFDPHEVAAIPPRHAKVVRSPGEIAARAFEAFREGTPMHEIVIELRESPDLIEQLHEKWLNMQGADLVISPGAKEALEKLFGPFRGVPELVELAIKELGERHGHQNEKEETSDA